MISSENSSAGQGEVSGYSLQPNPFKGGGGGIKDKIFKDDLDLDAVDIMREVIFPLLAPQQTGKQYRFMISIGGRPRIGPRLDDTHGIVLPQLTHDRTCVVKFRDRVLGYVQDAQLVHATHNSSLEGVGEGTVHQAAVSNALHLYSTWHGPVGYSYSSRSLFTNNLKGLTSPRRPLGIARKAPEGLGEGEGDRRTVPKLAKFKTITNPRNRKG
jgi:hypothetical protein